MRARGGDLRKCRRAQVLRVCVAFWEAQPRGQKFADLQLLIVFRRPSKPLGSRGLSIPVADGGETESERVRDRKKEKNRRERERERERENR